MKNITDDCTESTESQAKKRQRIMSLNLNSLGGKSEHLMYHQYYSNRDRQYHIDWKYWAHVDKTKAWMSFKKYILREDPDFLFVQEMLISQYEKIDFLNEMNQLGYTYIDESLPERGNYSLTMAFYKGERPEYIESPGNYRENRTVICRDAGILLCGSHFPYESDEMFLTYMLEFIQANQNGDILLIGDLNANDPTRGNKKMVNNLLQGGTMIDLWTVAGNAEDTPTEAGHRERLDYAIASISLAKNVQSIEIDSFPIESGMTDHAAIIVDILR